jgi:hypothetical protein
MNFTRDRVRSFGWVFVLTVCFALAMALMVRVNAVKSQVRLAERQLVALEREKIFLETEFETRANQQQLRALNDVEFGYQAPTAGQYLAGERQLAAFGKPAAADAPAPVRVASARSAEEAAPFPGMVSPLTGKAMAAEARGHTPGKPVDAEGLDKRLSQIRKREVVRE